MAAIAILWPRGTRSRAVTPAVTASTGIWSTATTTLSSGDRRMVLGVLMENPDFGDRCVPAPDEGCCATLIA
jgi:hypothetical protein